MTNEKNNPWATCGELRAENARLRAQLADANEIARQAVKEAKEATEELELCRTDAATIVNKLEEFKAAKKVADAAVRYYEFTGGISESLKIGELAAAIREYRALTEPLSPAKAAAVERGLENNNQ